MILNAKATTQKISFAFFLLLITHTFAQIDSYRWQYIHNHPFIIHYMDGDRDSAELVDRYLNSAYSRLCQAFQVTLSQPVDYYLCNSYDSYRKVVGTNVPLWSTGLALPQQNTIILKTVAAENNFLTTAVHELTHIFIDQLTQGNDIPRWLNEGLAVYFSNEKDFASSTLISKALISNSIIPLSDIDAVLSFNPSRAQLAYQESYVAVILLLERHGMESIRQILYLIGQGYEIDKAFSDTIGLDSWDFELQWHEYINRKYRWHFLVEFEFYLWIFIILLFIFGFIKIKHKNRLKLKQWEDEDQFDDSQETHQDDV